jgi:hypothetical protein
LTDVRELEEKEREKTEKRIQAIAEITVTNIEQTKSTSKVDWSFLFDFVLDPGLLADLGILRNVETPYGIRLGS